jgi:hypothetical protein
MLDVELFETFILRQPMMMRGSSVVALRLFWAGGKKASKLLLPETRTSYNTRLRHQNPPIISAI